MRNTDSIHRPVRPAAPLASALAVMLIVAVLPVPAVAQSPAAQASTAATEAVGEIAVGATITGGLDEVGRFPVYRDSRSGPTLDRLRYARDRDTWAFTAAFDRVGYRDQRYQATYTRFGRLTASFDWNQIPNWYSGVSQTPFREERPGVFSLDDGLQLGVQAGTATTASYATVLRAFDTRSRRDVASSELVYTLTADLDLRAGYRRQARHGAQPWSASFGFNNANELPLTLDQQTHDLSTAAEWSTTRGMLRVGYDGSWFDNGVDTLLWDNPLRATDRTHPSAYVAGDASARGQMSLFPDSSSHTVSAAGSVALPARSRATASVSVARWIQDQRLLPFTINSAIAAIPLPRETADGDALVTAMHYRFTSRPMPMLWLNGQFRLYDFDNRTPRFPVSQYVRLDGNAAASATGGSEPFAYTRQFVDVDASVTPVRFMALRVGYGREHDDRTYRVFEETVEHTLRTSLDSMGLPWGSLRLQYDRAERTGDGLDEEVLDEIGEQVSLRQFDISDRIRHRVSVIAQVAPWQMVALTGTAAVGRDHRPDAAFGLQDNDLRSVTVGLDVAPTDAVSVGGSYAFEHYSTLQRSRQANPGPQFNDPTRDWETDMQEHVHTWTIGLDGRLSERASLNASYDLVNGGSQYLYLLPAVSTLTPPQQLPELQTRYHRASAEARYALTARFALGVGYQLDKYVVEEFGRSPDILNTPLIPGFLNLMDQWRPYDVHSGSVRLIYRW